MSDLTDLAERRPDLWKDNPKERDRLLSGKRFHEYAENLTRRADAIEEPGMPKHRKLLTAGRSRAP